MATKQRWCLSQRKKKINWKTQMLELADKNFKTEIINKFKGKYILMNEQMKTLHRETKTT